MKCKGFVVALLLTCVSACGSPDEPQFKKAIATVFPYTPGLELTKSVIYREGEAKRACVEAQWENQFGERQPPYVFTLQYAPRYDVWNVIGADRRPNDFPGCKFFEDPNWQAKRDAAVAAQARKFSEESARQKQEFIDEAAQSMNDARAADARALETYERQEAESNARAEAESARREKELKAQSEAGEAKVLENLRRGPVEADRNSN